jgi:hypothetical protein
MDVVANSVAASPMTLSAADEGIGLGSAVGTVGVAVALGFCWLL